jgi:glutamyl-tRNA reductase
MRHELPYRVCGISFHESPVSVREGAAVQPARVPDALHFVADQPGVRECMLLSTCNRTELYLSAEPWVDLPDLFVRMAAAVRGSDLSPARGQIYVHDGAAAVAHLFRVAASLDSLVLGEPQILGQLKAAFRTAETAGVTERDLQRLVPKAFAAAKRVRCETSICATAMSASYAAVQLAATIFGDLAGKRVVLLGAGKMSELAALHLKEAGVSSITVANRTLSRAQEIARCCSGTAVEFERRFEEIARADVVLCSTDAPHYVIDAKGVGDLLHRRGRHPLLLVDLSVPRNVDPAVAALEGVFLFNVDDLDRVVAANRAARRAEAGRAEPIVDAAVEKFLRDKEQEQLAPTITAIRNQVRSICREEMERFEQKVPELAAADREELEVMLHRIAQKIVHPVICELKATAGGPDGRARLIERSFGIEGMPAWGTNR